jgi:hypothetical protein
VPVNLKIPFAFVTNFLLMIAVEVANLGSISVTAGAVDPTVPNRLAIVIAGTLGAGQIWQYWKISRMNSLG